MELVGLTAAVLVAFCVGAPLLTLLHELGHGIAALLAIGGRVTVTQGPAPARLELSLGRLDLRLRGPVAPHHGWIGWAFWEAHPQRRRLAAACAGGPLASAACAAACFYGFVGTSGPVHVLLFLLGGSAGGQMLSSGLPVRYGRWFGQYGGVASDGLNVLLLLFARAAAPAPVVVASGELDAEVAPADGEQPPATAPAAAVL